MNAPDEDEELDVEFETESYPDTLSTADQAVFFYPDLGSFCEEHDAKAVMVSKDSVWLLPKDGGKWFDIQDFGKQRRGSLKTVQ